MNVRDRRRSTRLRGWGITSVFDDLRGAEIQTEARVETTARVVVVKRRASFTVDCLECGPSPHVSPDDHAVAVCLRCGLDRWL
jgi:hypothetical protein